MPPKNEQLQKMITKAEEQIEKMQAQIDSGELSAEDQAEALETIEAMNQKIEKLTSKVR